MIIEELKPKKHKNQVEIHFGAKALEPVKLLHYEVKSNLSPEDFQKKYPGLKVLEHRHNEPKIKSEPKKVKIELKVANKKANSKKIKKSK